MSAVFKINADLRQDKGKGASRRLRKKDLVPGIIYGITTPTSIQVLHKDLAQLLEDEHVYTSIVEVKLNNKVEMVVLRDLQRHAYKAKILHFDFQRIKEDQDIVMRVPIHFIGEESAPGVKVDGGIISHLVADVAVSCLPKYLPEFIEVDLSKMELNQVIKLSNLTLPEGVKLLNLMQGKDSTIVTLYAFKEEKEATETNQEQVVTSQN